MISVIVPVYNVEKYLRECLDSIVNQKAVEYEVICVNDGSTDGSLGILKEYAEKHTAITVISQENKGLSGARNTGMKFAKGDFIYFLDSDDYLADDMALNFMCRQMREYQLDVLYMDAETVFESEEIREANETYNNHYIKNTEYGFYKKGIELFAEFENQKENLSQISLRCFRRRFLVEYSLEFPEGCVYEDNLFSIKTAVFAKNVMHKKYIAFCYRVRSGSIMQSEATAEKVKSALSIYKKMMLVWRNYIGKEFFYEIYRFVTRMRERVVRNYTGLGEQEKNKLEQLSDNDRELLNYFLESSSESVQYRQIVRTLIAEKSRVVVYGAGKIGTKVSNELSRSNYAKVVGVVDKAASELVRYDFVVMGIDVLNSLDYDTLLIAVKDRKTASDIKKELVKSGVDYNKIIWYGECVPEKNESKYLRQQRTFTWRILSKYSKRIFLFCLPESGNIGDYAIAIAEEHFLARCFSEYQVIPVTKSEWKEMKGFFFDLITTEDVIMIIGGGFLGDMWSTGSECREIVEWFPDNKIVIMPQTLTYLEGIENNEKVAEDLFWYFSHSNLHMLFRERNSYAKCCEIGYSDRCSLVPDMALSLDYREEKSADKNAKKVLLCIRTDQEKLFDDKEVIENILQKQGYEYDETDIHLKRYIPQEQGQYYLEKKIAEFQQYDFVITDRLHGMILSWVAGVPVVAFDNSTHKVSGVYEWLKEDSQVWFCKDIIDFENTLQKLQENQSMFRVSFEKEFEKLAGCIRTIIEK